MLSLLRIFIFQKTIVKEWQEAIVYKKIFSYQISDKILVSRLYKNLSKVNNKKLSSKQIGQNI